MHGLSVSLVVRARSTILDGERKQRRRRAVQVVAQIVERQRVLVRDDCSRRIQQFKRLRRGRRNGARGALCPEGGV